MIRTKHLLNNYGNALTSHLMKKFSSTNLSFAIIGSGPAGLYTAKKLYADMRNEISVHIFEKQLVPSGLIRYGMAPDHEKIKKVADDLLAIDKNPSFKFFGGVEIGKHLSVQELQKYYSAIIFAYGAEEDKLLNVPGEESQGVYSGREIVNWYNSAIDQNLQINLETVRDIIIVGNGNVSIDICRVLGQSVDILKRTDINLDALAVIKERQIKNFFIVGRRGLVQSAFTLKEVRELCSVEGMEVYLYKPDMVESSTDSSIIEAQDQGIYFSNETRANRRKLEFMKTLNIIEDEKAMDQLLQTPTNIIRLIFRFLLSPVEISKTGENLTMKFQNMKLKGEPFKQTIYSAGSQEFINCQMIIKSIGYRSTNIDNDLLWDQTSNTLQNSNGCLQKKSDPQYLEVGLYAAGWIKTGPIGVVDQTYRTCIETIVNIKNHLEMDLITLKNDPFENIQLLLKEKQIQYTNMQDWRTIDEHEKSEGAKINKKRLKLKTTQEILASLSQTQISKQ